MGRCRERLELDLWREIPQSRLDERGDTEEAVAPIGPGNEEGVQNFFGRQAQEFLPFDLTPPAACGPSAPWGLGPIPQLEPAVVGGCHGGEEPAVPARELLIGRIRRMAVRSPALGA